MSDSPCPCNGATFPEIVWNTPGLPSIVYRWGDYDGFRAALLQPLPGEAELTDATGAPVWRPTPDGGDLALQIAEWWAYLADILTLYTERAANQAYLRTADLPESLPRLVPLLGYRPRPAIGAQVTLAGLVRGPRPVVLPQGLAVQSKPGPGQQPQIFELAAATTIQPVAAIATLPPVTVMPAPPATASATGQVVLAGKPSSLKAGDEALLIAANWAGLDGNWARITVTGLTPANANTTVAFTVTVAGAASFTLAGAANWRLMKAANSATLYPYLGSALSAIGSDYVELVSVVRSIAPGDPILIENPAPAGTPAPVLCSVTGATELIYYANNPDAPGTWPPTPAPAPTLPAVPIPHTKLSFVTQSAIGTPDASTLVVRYGYADAGTLIDAPVVGATSISAAPLDPAGLATAGLAAGSPLLLADANGDGAAATLGANQQAVITTGAPQLVPPLRAFSNLLSFTRGKTVRQEVVGDGNHAIAGQDFTLRNTPVTYLADAPGNSGDGYSSTIALYVNGVQWQEVPSFFGQPPNAQVFVTREDTSGTTHVLGGDGTNGARFPTGSGNIVATYRTGAGVALPPPTSLTVLLQPQPGLAALVNPVPPFGGADADAATALRQSAPASVVTLGRAVSVDDYAAIAASAPGVARVSAAYAFDAGQQRPVVTLWVGDDAGSVAAAQQAIAAVSDPNRPVLVSLAQAVSLQIALNFLCDPRYVIASVQAGVLAALTDPAAGLFGAQAVQIGQAFFDSQIYAACLAVPGVTAVRNLVVTVGAGLNRFYPWQLSQARLAAQRVPALPGVCTGHRYTPGPDGYFTLPTAPTVTGSFAP